MKLAEAISIRSELQKRLDQMQQRIASAGFVPKDDTPAFGENFDEVMAEFHSDLRRLEEIIDRINRTNARTVLADGMTIAEKIVRRDMLKKQCNIMNGVFKELNNNYSIRAMNERKIVFDLREFRAQIREKSAELRKTDLELQSANWAVDLCD